MSTNYHLHRWIIIIVWVVLPFLSFSQWDSIYYHPGFVFTKVFAQNKDTAFVVGYSGLLLKTTNSGSTWDQITLPTTKTLFDITFVNSSTGYLCGSGGLVLKTNDGGNNWTPCNTNTTLNLRTLCFANENTGWFGGSTSDSAMTYVGDSGIIIKTINGGNDFIIEQRLNLGVQTIRCINSDTCFAIGNKTDKTVNVYRTFNSGSIWQLVYNDVSDHSYTSLVTFNTGKIIVSYELGDLLESTDFGNSWTLHEPQNLWRINELSFPSNDTAYAVGYYPLQPPGAIYKTTDGGNIWNQQMHGDFVSISMVNDTVGYSVTNDGKIFKTSDGGSILGIPAINRVDNSEILVHPNPFTTDIEISIWNKLWVNLEKPIAVEIYSVTGEIVFQKEEFLPEFHLNILTSLSTGLYYLLIRNGGKIIFNQKIVKIE